MKTGVILAVVMMTIVASAARAQTTVRPTAEEQRRQDGMGILEGTLTGAVRDAARKVAKEVQSGTPSAMLYAGSASAKGFSLEGFGVFFYVEIPAVDMTIGLMVDAIERDAQRRIDQQVTNKLDAPPPSAKETLRTITAEDPGQKYRDAVKLALADAMLDYSKNLELKPDEWLSVAARGSEGGLLPNEIYQLTTVVLRVKGSDLAEYLAGRITKDQARQKVEMRQF